MLSLKLGHYQRTKSTTIASHRLVTAQNKQQISAKQGLRYLDQDEFLPP